MLPCETCAYKTSVPGNAHIQCSYAWDPDREQVPRGHLHGIKMGWFYFPMLFDPTWGPDSCVAFTTERDPAKVETGGSARLLLAMLRGAE